MIIGADIANKDLADMQANSQLKCAFVTQFLVASGDLHDIQRTAAGALHGIVVIENRHQAVASEFIDVSAMGMYGIDLHAQIPAESFEQHFQIDSLTQGGKAAGVGKT